MLEEDSDANEMEALEFEDLHADPVNPNSDSNKKRFLILGVLSVLLVLAVTIFVVQSRDDQSLTLEDDQSNPTGSTQSTTQPEATLLDSNEADPNTSNKEADPEQPDRKNDADSGNATRETPEPSSDTKFSPGQTGEASLTGCTTTVSSNLQAAIDAASSGSTICVSGGSYGEINITSDNVTIKSTGAKVAGGIKITGDDATVEGFELSDQGIYIGADNATISNNYIHDTSGNAIECENSKEVRCHGLKLLNNTMERSTGEIAAVWGDNVLVENNILKNPRVSGSSDDTDTLHVMAGTNQVVRNNYFELPSSFDGKDPGHPDCIMMFDSANAGFQGWTRNNEVLIEGNICNNNFADHNGFILAGKNEGQSKGWTVRNNVCDHNNGGCFLFMNLSDIVVENNLCSERSKACVSFLDGSSDAKISNNVGIGMSRGEILWAGAEDFDSGGNVGGSESDVLSSLSEALKDRWDYLQAVK